MGSEKLTLVQELCLLIHLPSRNRVLYLKTGFLCAALAGLEFHRPLPPECWD